MHDHYILKATDRLGSVNIHNEDAMTMLPRCTHANLIFCDPPFNINQPYHTYRDSLPTEDFLFWFTQIVDLIANRILPNGAIWFNLPDWLAWELPKIIGTLRSTSHWTRRHTIIWHYRFGQSRRTGFIPTHTVLYHMVAGPGPGTWNEAAVREPCDRATKYNDPRAQTSETPGLRTPFDVWYGPGFSRITASNMERRELHPNQLPEALLYRIIASTSNPGDMIIDPFLGSGTTTTIARALNRRSIGIELSPDYTLSALQRTKDGPTRTLDYLRNPSGRTPE